MTFLYDVRLRSYGASNLPNFRILAFVGGTCAPPSALLVFTIIYGFVRAHFYHKIPDKEQSTVKSDWYVKRCTMIQKKSVQQISELSDAFAWLAFECSVELDFCTGWAEKTGLFLSADNFAATNARNTCYMSKVSDFCLE